MLDTAAEGYMERSPGTCMDTSSDFDVLLSEVPAATIRRADATLFDGAPDDVRPLPASLVKVIVEVVSPSSRKADKLDKMAEYADAGIPFYWLVWLSGDHVVSIDIHVLNHTLGYYRLREEMWLAYAAMTSAGQKPQRRAASVITKVNVLVVS